MRAAINAVEIHLEVGLGVLHAVRHDFFAHDERCLVGKRCFGFAVGAVNALDLGGLHFHIRALGKICHGGGVHDIFAVAVTLTVVLFNISYARVLGKVKGVNAAVLTGISAAVVDTAPRHDRDVAVLTDVKVVVNKLFDTRLREQNGDMQTLVFRAGLHVNVDALLVGLCHDLDVFGVVLAKELAVNYSHLRPDGTLWYTIAPGVAGENIAKGQTSATGVMNDWMNSEGHRKNILTKSYTEIGVGCYYDNATDTYYWVQLFA